LLLACMAIDSTTLKEEQVALFIQNYLENRMASVDARGTTT